MKRTGAMLMNIAGKLLTRRAQIARNQVWKVVKAAAEGRAAQ